MSGQVPRHRGTGDHMGAGECADARQRCGRVRRPRRWRAVAHLDDFHQRGRGDRLPLRMRRPFLRCAVDAHDHPRLSNPLFEVGTVKRADPSGNRGRIGRGVDNLQESYEMLRVESGGCDPAAVLRLENGERERVADRERRLKRSVVQGRLPGPAGGKRIARQHPNRPQLLDQQAGPGRHRIDGLAKVHAEVLRLPGSLAPDRGRADARSHCRDGHAGSGAEAALNERVAPREGDVSTTVVRTAAGALHELRELGVDVECASIRNWLLCKYLARSRLP